MPQLALLLTVLAADPVPLGDPPPPPDTVPVAPEPPEPAPPPPDLPPQPPPVGETSVAGSVAVGAFGAALGAGVGAMPSLFVLLSTARSPLNDDALLPLLALAALPSVAALGAGMLAVMFVVDRPGWNDAADVLLCSAMTCLAPVLLALVVAAAGGGGGGGGCGSGCGSCGSGSSCNDPSSGRDLMESPALMHATGAAFGAFAGVSLGTIAIAVELDEPTRPQPRPGALTLAILVGAGAGFFGAIVGGAVGGLLGAEMEDDRRTARAASSDLRAAGGPR